MFNTSKCVSPEYNVRVLWVPFAAGNFLYLVGSDLVPELRDDKDILAGLMRFALMGLGVLLMYLVKFL